MDLSNMPVIPALLMAAGTCGTAAWMTHRHRRIAGPREFKIWATLALIFLTFVVLKLENVAGNVESAARDQFKADGLYSQRHILQLTVVIGAAVLGIGQGLWYAKHITQRWRRYRWPFISVLTIFCFAAIRAVSLHELDALGVWLTVAKVIIEIAAALLAAWGALQRIAELRTQRTKALTT